MANALAIAAVSAVLKDLLNNGLIDAQLSSDVTVRVGPPPSVNGTTIPTQLNLFLYHVAPNLGWRNERLPSHNSQGDRVSNPPLALDLHYLLTAYGAEEFEAEILLGYAMQLLHENAILSRGAIRRTFSGAPTGVSGSILPASSQALVAAGLAEQLELIKISLLNLNGEEMSRIWSSLQTHYRISTAYHVSVVLIESQRSTRSAPPVLNHRIFAQPLQSPLIERVEPQVVGAGGRLTLKGQSLRGNPTQVAFGDSAVVTVPVAPTDQVSDRQIEVTLPGSLQAGVNTVQVLHPLNLGTPTEPHRSVDSNVVAFILQPNIVRTAEGPPPVYAMGFLADEAAFIAAFPDEDERDRFTREIEFPAVWLQVNPVVFGNQRLALLLNETPRPGDRTARAYSFSDPALLIDAPDIPAGQTTADLLPEDQRSDRLIFPISGVVSGNYLVRIRVSGAESSLTREPPLDPADPMGAFTGPLLTIGGQ
jgi:hypothetical protein